MRINKTTALAVALSLGMASAAFAQDSNGGSTPPANGAGMNNGAAAPDTGTAPEGGSAQSGRSVGTDQNGTNPNAGGSYQNQGGSYENKAPPNNAGQQ